MWDTKDNGLYAKLEFKDFSEAFAFMTEVAMAAEKANHHPEWSNVWNKVDIKLNTHDAGGKVTEQDLALSKVIQNIYSKYKY